MEMNKKMSQYAIPLRVKLSEKEYDKLKHATNKSQYVRTAINFYDAKQPQEIELAKKRLLDDIIKEVKKEKSGYSVELMGFLLIMISIIGWIPKTGVIGHFIRSFCIFLSGP